MYMYIQYIISHDGDLLPIFTFSLSLSLRNFVADGGRVIFNSCDQVQMKLTQLELSSTRMNTSAECIGEGGREDTEVCVLVHAGCIMYMYMHIHVQMYMTVHFVHVHVQ